VKEAGRARSIYRQTVTVAEARSMARARATKSEKEKPSFVAIEPKELPQKSFISQEEEKKRG